MMLAALLPLISVGIGTIGLGVLGSPIPSTTGRAPSPRYPGEVFPEVHPTCPSFDALRESLQQADGHLDGAGGLYKRAFALAHHNAGIRDVLRRTTEAKAALQESLERIEEAERRLTELEAESGLDEDGDGHEGEAGGPGRGRSTAEAGG